jgi:hypothetical protein
MEDGSDAHELKGAKLSASGFDFVVDDEMVEGVQSTLDFVREKINRYKDEGHEVRVYIEKGLSCVLEDEAYGTADIIIHVANERLIVIDFKYGRGITVEPTSEQNKYYGYLAVENYLSPDETVKVVESWISQPRIPHSGGPNRRHVTNAEELIDWWMGTVLPGIEATRDPNALLVTGDHCRWCPANKLRACPALKGEALEMTTDIDQTYLTNDELSQLLLKTKTVVQYLKDLEGEAFKRAVSGSPVAGFKLVRKISKRASVEGSATVR